jgi:hypothetical protein
MKPILFYKWIISPSQMVFAKISIIVLDIDECFVIPFNLDDPHNYTFNEGLYMKKGFI